jgi:hypothetical protein
MLEESQLSIFGADCKMPAAGPQNVLSVEQKFLSSFTNNSVDLSKTYTNEIRRQDQLIASMPAATA